MRRAAGGDVVDGLVCMSALRRACSVQVRTCVRRFDTAWLFSFTKLSARLGRRRCPQRRVSDQQHLTWRQHAHVFPEKYSRTQRGLKVKRYTRIDGNG